MHRTTRPPTAARLAGAVALTALLAGCASTTTVDYTEDEVTVPVGATLVVDFGSVSSSIGDDWLLTTPPDPAVLGEGVEDWDFESDLAGSYADLTWRFAALAPGTTTVGFTYALRGEVGDPWGRTADPEPTITVTVTP